MIQTSCAEYRLLVLNVKKLPKRERATYDGVMNESAPEFESLNEDIQEMLTTIENLLAYQDAIPEAMVGSTDADPKFMARKGWFTSISALLAAMENFGIIEKNTPAVTAFRTDVLDKVRVAQKTEAVDIEQGKTMLGWMQDILRKRIEQ
jgi:predicted NUDIX family phosphoesterase